MSATAEPGAAPRAGYGPTGWGPPMPPAPPGGWNPWSLAWSVPKPWLIVATVFGFIAFWPIGLAMLFFLLGSGRIGRHAMNGHGSPAAGSAAAMSARGCGWRRRERDAAPASSGNSAFDEYREDTLRRLEEEQREFGAFLERLRFAKDKSEFDA
ncbi:MAG: DUF2852 domain-containing protein, partial [Acetobacteraceae bacterium]|nr:DUF2852 domain-containing protein [Acetobacteraceae bacterium]